MPKGPASEVLWLRRQVEVLTAALAQAVEKPQAGLPSAAPEPAPGKRPPSEIAAAIKEESGGNAGLAAWFRKRVKEMKAEGKSDGDIVAAIRAWETTEPKSET